MTPERNQRIRSVLARRQTDLCLCLDQVHKPHNLSALIRSAEAVGVHHVHAIWHDDESYLRRNTSKGAHDWVNVHNHVCVAEAAKQFKAEGKQVLVCHLSEQAVDYRRIDYTKPTAIIMGQEKRGASNEAIEAADKQVIIPIMGMVESLNVSVAAAVILYEALRQREAAGCYERTMLPPEEQQRLLFLGGYPRLYQQCVERNLPFPFIDEEGQIQADQQWWQALQYSQPRQSV